MFDGSTHDVAVSRGQLNNYVIWDGVVPPEFSQFLEGVNESAKETHVF